MKWVLVTGGVGYIGSHVCVELLNADYSVIVVDNLANSKQSVIDKINKITGKNILFFHVDICDLGALEIIFKSYSIFAIIHLAGMKSTTESIQKPIDYYKINVGGTLNLLSIAKTHGVEKFVFSSSATVYGTEGVSPLVETSSVGKSILNPYGRTKFFTEEIIKDESKTTDCKFTILRYFNPVGCHPSGLLGEDPNNKPNNLMPYLLKVVMGIYDTLEVYGNDYPTPDGTCLRDFIHVSDLARAHISCLTYSGKENVEIFNIGTGFPVSVMELIQAFIKTNNVLVPFKISPRREGDVPVLYANCDKAERVLGWKAQKTIEDVCRDTYLYIKKNSLGED